MRNMAINNRMLFFLLIIFISCKNQYNRKKLNTISELEQTITRDFYNLNELNMNEVQNALKIAKLNLEKIEEKKLDSVSMDLIYFEYSQYLHCVNRIYEGSKEINKITNLLTNNQSQLQDLKADYTNSKFRRDDLDDYLQQEISIINQTSSKLDVTISQLKAETYKFEEKNKKIEELMK